MLRTQNVYAGGWCTKHFNNLTVKDLQFHVDTVLEKLYNYKTIGFVNNSILRDNDIYSNLIKSYTSLKVKFQFPASVMYPNLAVRLDKGSVMYPLSGISFCTGLEILLAHKLGCKLTVDIIQQDIK